MKKKTEGEMINAYQRMVYRVKLSALGLKHHCLDNECLAKFKECITKNGMMQELAPPDCHRQNIAERAIRMFKNHFISILSGVDARFPPPCGATLCNQWNLPSTYYNRAILHQKCLCMPMSTGNMTK